jgi:hypothetical protein
MYQTAEIRGRNRSSYGENCTRPSSSNSTNSVANSTRPKAAKCVEFHKLSGTTEDAALGITCTPQKWIYERENYNNKKEKFYGLI